MVNVQPIPPLLCSTPPPIDFGEDDEDVDDLPQALDGVENDDFVGFLSEDDTKTIEPLPSPRPPSVCDLPSVSIYDDLVPPEEEDLTNHIATSPPRPINDNISKDSKNNTKSVTEAYNFNVRNTNNDTKTVLKEEITSLSMGVKTVKSIRKTIEEETESDDYTTNSHNVYSKDEHVKDLRCESLNAENGDKTNINCILDVVSIEDIVDDLSDNELYLSKNFIETDNLNDYFKIEEINTVNTVGSAKRLDSEDPCSKSLNVLDNNESASLEKENQNIFQSLSSNSFVTNKFDTPPPLPDDVNSIDEDDDFGDFADFQETHFVNNTVPVNNISINQNNINDLELNDINKYKNINTTEVIACQNINGIRKKIESVYLNEINDSEKLNEEFSEFASNNVTITDTFEAKQEEMSKQHSSGSEISVDEDYEDKLILNKKEQSIEEVSRKDDSFVAFAAQQEINESSDIGNFADPQRNHENTNSKANENIKNTNILSNHVTNDDDEFDDFADFKTQQEVTKSEEIASCSYEVVGNGGKEDTDDDDFGDFNTAQPITHTAPNVTINKTSQNTINETPAIPSKNLNERISNILQLMFSPATYPANETSQPKTNKIQDIPFTSIDTAKALEYQWIISETRHSFIRSLGIDSKNILFGDNWNPTLPRFAANLSFNPLKPMKPIHPSTSTTECFHSVSEPLSSIISETTQVLEMSGSTKMDLNWNPSNERAIEALKDDNIPSSATAPIPCIYNDPRIKEQVSAIDNPLVYEDKISKTPPISEMESVTTFTSPPLSATMDMEVPTIQIVPTIDDFDLKEVKESLKNPLNVNEVVATSTFSGTFKETHIYTPPKTNDFENKHVGGSSSALSSSPTKALPIDFDYEKAAMGVIIDETVVKKEYRDVEYNPPFTMESISKSATSKTDIFEMSNYADTKANITSSIDIKVAVVNDSEQDSNDDFSEFQSVSSEVTNTAVTSIAKTTNPLEAPKTKTVSHGGMILSPAILIPQAISMKNQKPKIEWGDSTATINPEELARIEELFPEPKSIKSSNSSQKSTPTHQVSSTPSISATVANKELEGNTYNINDDDDDWSDFVSVPVTNNSSTNRTVINNNFLVKSPDDSPFQQRSPVVSHRMPPTTYNNSNYDEEWSEFVSSAPPPQQASTYRVPQFNSGAWQNANFYNNPLSMYHKGPLNISTAAAPTHSAQKSFYNNNNNYNISQQPYQIANNLPNVTIGINQQKPNNAYQQQVHVMQNFSTAPVPTPERLSAAVAAAKSNQFQSIGSAKVAPSIALIPDLGFVAPAIPTHTSFISSLPKPSINTKK